MYHQVKSQSLKNQIPHYAAADELLLVLLATTIITIALVLDSLWSREVPTIAHTTELLIQLPPCPPGGGSSDIIRSSLFKSSADIKHFSSASIM